MFDTSLVITVAQAEGSQGREIAEGLARRLGLTYVDEAVIKLATENLDQCEIEAYIRELGRHGRVLIVGCGANFILRDFSGVVNILLEAPLSCRIERVMQEQNLSRPSAERRVFQADGRYAAYIRRYYGPEWTDTDLYDLVINTARLTSSEAIETLSRFIGVLNQRRHQAHPSAEPANVTGQTGTEANASARLVELLHK